MITVVGVIVFLLSSSTDRLVNSSPLNNTIKDVSFRGGDLFSSNAFLEEVTARVTPLLKIKPIERIEVQKLDSSPQATNRNNEKATHGGNIDNITQLQKQYKGKKGHKSAKFGEKKGHKKGHKTRGYNNRFHKDEYVKEHKLYGDGYRNNQRNQYKNAHDASAKKRTSYEKSNKRNHGYSEDKFGKKGVDDVGKFDKRHKDFERDSNHQQYNNHHTKNIELKEATNPYPNHRPY